MMDRVRQLIEQLNLAPHPEGGYYSETYRSEQKINDRNLATAIYFLITDGNVSNFHRIKSDELWFFHEGDSLTVHSLTENGHIERQLGVSQPDEAPFQLVPAGEIFGSCIRKVTLGYSLVSCVVAPGFDFRDFELFGTEELLDQFPEAEKIIRRLSRPVNE